MIVYIGCVATTITYPLDLMKANESLDMTQTKGVQSAENELSFIRRMQHRLSLRNIGANFKEDVEAAGIRNFKDAFRGLVPTIFAVPMFIGIQNMSYDFMRIYLTSPDYLDMTPSIELFAGCGCAAGIVAQYVFMYTVY